MIIWAPFQEWVAVAQCQIQQARTPRAPNKARGPRRPGASWKLHRTSLNKWLKFRSNASVTLASCGRKYTCGFLSCMPLPFKSQQKERKRNVQCNAFYLMSSIMSSITYIIAFTGTLFSHVDLNYGLRAYLSAQRTSFSISFKKGLLATNAGFASLIWKCLHFSFTLSQLYSDRIHIPYNSPTETCQVMVLG